MCQTRTKTHINYGIRNYGIHFFFFPLWCHYCLRTLLQYLASQWPRCEVVDHPIIRLYHHINLKTDSQTHRRLFLYAGLSRAQRSATYQLLWFGLCASLSCFFSDGYIASFVVQKSLDNNRCMFSSNKIYHSSFSSEQHGIGCFIFPKQQPKLADIGSVGKPGPFHEHNTKLRASFVQRLNNFIDPDLMGLQQFVQAQI